MYHYLTFAMILPVTEVACDEAVPSASTVGCRWCISGSEKNINVHHLSWRQSIVQTQHIIYSFIAISKLKSMLKLHIAIKIVG